MSKSGSTLTGGRSPSASRGRFKFDPRDGFVQVPNFVVDLIGEGLNPQALAVLLYAARHSWRGGSDFSVAKCQSDLSIGKRGWLYAVLPCLRKLGALTVERLPAVNGRQGWRHVFEWPTATTMERGAAEVARLEAAKAAKAAKASALVSLDQQLIPVEGEPAGPEVPPVDNPTPESLFSDGHETGLSGAEAPLEAPRWSQNGTSVVTKRDHLFFHTSYVGKGGFDPETHKRARIAELAMKGASAGVPTSWLTPERLAAMVASGELVELDAIRLADAFGVGVLPLSLARA